MHMHSPGLSERRIRLFGLKSPWIVTTRLASSEVGLRWRGAAFVRALRPHRALLRAIRDLMIGVAVIRGLMIGVAVIRDLMTGVAIAHYKRLELMS